MKSKNYEVSITVRYLKGAKSEECDRADHDSSSSSESHCLRLTAEMRWIGSRRNRFMAWRKKVMENFTKEADVDQNGVVQWDEKFKNTCTFSGSAGRNDGFDPWEVAFIILKSSSQEENIKVNYGGPAILDLAKYSSINVKQELEISVPLFESNSSGWYLPLYVTLDLRELIMTEEPSRTYRRSLTSPLGCFRVPATLLDTETQTQEPSLRRARSLKAPFSRWRSKKDYRVEAITETPEENCQFHDSSLDHGNESFDTIDQNLFRYGSLSDSILARKMYFGETSCKSEHLVYNESEKLEGDKTFEGKLKLSPKITKFKEFMSLKSEKKTAKGEPLLKKEGSEMGGDDLDFIRREQFKIDLCKKSEFGDDSFKVGSWEYLEVTSRDRSLKLLTHVFFATIDQRSKEAAGESACTVLAIVVAHWLHSHPNLMPNKSELDALIVEGSLKWRNLCQNESLLKEFSDKHFDLRTVVEAKICPTPINVVSTTGFFHPKLLDKNGIVIEYLNGVNMPFDRLWDEVEDSSENESKSLIYVVSWNDHFFVLKVDMDAFYIVDTLGERLMEGCQRAYVLKFDSKAEIRRIGKGVEDDTSMFCSGKEACKQYIKYFLAAVPIRELRDDAVREMDHLELVLKFLQIDLHRIKFLTTLT